jgi:hypothetical protein
LERDGAVYRVATAAGEIRAVLRGKTKRDSPHVVVGDRVRLEPEPTGDLYGVVGIEPRTTLLERRVPEGRGARPVAANIDEVFVVTATVDPAPIPQLIDRLLVVAEANTIQAAVVVNKIELDPGRDLIERCRASGYAVYPTSAKTGEGVEAFAKALAGRVSVVTGPSGAGKSSLLNAVQPGQEHHRLCRDAASRHRRIPGRYAGVQRGWIVGCRSARAPHLLSGNAAVHWRVPLRRLPAHDGARLPGAFGGGLWGHPGGPLGELQDSAGRAGGSAGGVGVTAA